VPWEGWAAWCNETRGSRQSSKRIIIKQHPGSNTTKNVSTNLKNKSAAVLLPHARNILQTTAQSRIIRKTSMDVSQIRADEAG
jgi:hypothetical protein